MVILDQSKPISLIFAKKNHNFKNPKFGHNTFIIHTNENKTGLQLILKSNSTSSMFNNIFCEMKGKKVIHWGGIGGNLGTIPIASWKCNLGICLDIQVYYLDIQAITTLYAFYWFFMCWFLLYINFSTLQPRSWKLTILSLWIASSPRVLNLQSPTLAHFEE